MLLLNRLFLCLLNIFNFDFERLWLVKQDFFIVRFFNCGDFGFNFDLFRINTLFRLRFFLQVVSLGSFEEFFKNLVQLAAKNFCRNKRISKQLRCGLSSYL